MTPLEAEAMRTASELVDDAATIDYWLQYRASAVMSEGEIMRLEALKASLLSKSQRLIEAEAISTENVTAFPGLDGEPQAPFVFDGPDVA